VGDLKDYIDVQILKVVQLTVMAEESNIHKLVKLATIIVLAFLKQR